MATGASGDTKSALTRDSSCDAAPSTSTVPLTVDHEVDHEALESPVSGPRGGGEARHVPAMSASVPEPRPDDEIVDLAWIMDRYRIRKSRAYDLVKERWFPRPILRGRWSMYSILRAEARRTAA